MKFIVEIRFVLTSTQARWYVPKCDVRVFRFFEYQFEASSVPYHLGKIFGVVKVLVNMSFQSVRSLCDEKQLTDQYNCRIVIIIAVNKAVFCTNIQIKPPIY